MGYSCVVCTPAVATGNKESAIVDDLDVVVVDVSLVRRTSQAGKNNIRTQNRWNDGGWKGGNVEKGWKGGEREGGKVERKS